MASYSPSDSEYLRHYFNIPKYIPDEQINLYVNISIEKKKARMPPSSGYAIQFIQKLGKNAQTPI